MEDNMLRDIVIALFVWNQSQKIIKNFQFLQTINLRLKTLFHLLNVYID